MFPAHPCCTARSAAPLASICWPLLALLVIPDPPPPPQPPNPPTPHTLFPALPPLQKYPIADVRGRGLMLAAEFGEPQPGGGIAARPHTAADLAHAAGQRGLLLLGAGARGLDPVLLLLLWVSAWAWLQPAGLALPASSAARLLARCTCRRPRDDSLPAAAQRQRGRGGGGAGHL